MQLTEMDRLELRFLRDHPYAWGGHLKRGEPVENTSFVGWVKQGIIQAAVSPAGEPGYLLTAKGRQLLLRR